jgi:hypothetical protein
VVKAAKTEATSRGPIVEKKVAKATPVISSMFIPVRLS